MRYKGSGILIYDPNRQRMKHKTDWWCVVEVDREITRYLRWWVKKELWIDLNPPAWDAHISVIRGERPRQQHMHLWRKYHRQKIEFEYDQNPKRAVDPNGGYFWFVETYSTALYDIRTELEFPAHWKFHLTFGRTYY